MEFIDEHLTKCVLHPSHFARRKNMWQNTLAVSASVPMRYISSATFATDNTTQPFGTSSVFYNHSQSTDLLMWFTNRYSRAGVDGCLLYCRGVVNRLGRRHEHTVPVMFTSADVTKFSVVTVWCPTTNIKITAVTTAGVKTNAMKSGVDVGNYVEQPTPVGTINTVVLASTGITDSGLVRAIVTATEAKTAALTDMCISSSYTPGVISTGTGTDTIIMAAPVSEAQISYTGGHSIIGSAIGMAVYKSVTTAVCKQA